MLRYLFPRELKVSVKSYAFLVNINNEMWKRYKEEIEFDFSATKIIYTNHLAMKGLMEKHWWILYTGIMLQ